MWEIFCLLKEYSHAWKPYGDFTRSALTNEDQVVTIIEINKSHRHLEEEIIVCNSKSEIFSVFSYRLLHIDKVEE